MSERGLPKPFLARFAVTLQQAPDGDSAMRDGLRPGPDHAAPPSANHETGRTDVRHETTDDN